MEIAAIAVSVPEACRLLSVGRTKLHELFKTGEIPTVKLGRRTLVPVAAIQGLVARKTQEAI